MIKFTPSVLDVGIVVGIDGCYKRNHTWKKSDRIRLMNKIREIRNEAQ